MFMSTRPTGRLPKKLIYTAGGFISKKIPENLDAIVIGSGIGGLSTAALLSRAGKKVLVLEQHDQAGGCCHTFIEKGFEFDVGIHYIGEVANNTLTHTFINQISGGQISWNLTNDVIDQVELGTGQERSSHKIWKGREKWRSALKEDFPDESEAIDKFFHTMKIARRAYPITFLLKALPLFLSNLLINTGMLSLISDYPKLSKQSVREFLDSITDNERLKATLSYSFGDYGTEPKDGPVVMQALLMNHYTHGGYYPVGGASEIAFHIIPVIEKAGGKVLVRANVTEIILENGTAKGVVVSKGGEKYPIRAPIVISAAGIINTYEKLLPKSFPSRPYFEKILSKVKSGHGAISIFIGLKGSAEELQLRSTNTWAFSEWNLDKGFKEFYDLPKEEVGKTDIPLLFISFPCTKDPLWNERYPGKSNCTVVTLANYKWFEEWENTRINKRGESYEDFKKRIAEKALEQVCRYYPQISDKVEYIDVGSPLTNQYYIASPKGEIYGLNHDKHRFSPEVSALLRPATSVNGLYLTGQDISSCGFAGALYSGLLTSSVILKRNLMNDLVALTKKIKSESKKDK